MDLLRCENLYRTYGSGSGATEAVKDVTIQLRPGMFYALIGRSGSGKSTLLNMLSGLLVPTGGKVYYGEKDISRLTTEERAAVRRQKIGLVFQDHRLLPELTVKENIILPSVLDGRKPDTGWLETVVGILEIGSLLGRYPDELSGGQKQRAAIGRAVMNRPDYIFADEPTGNLDRKTSEAVLRLFLDLKALYGPVILVATHDLDIARSSDHIFRIEDGMVSECNEGGILA